MTTKTTILVRYAETDQMGIVHHSNYAIWYEQARTEFIRAYGLSYGEMEKRGILLPLLELGSRFSAPAHYEDLLLVETRITQLTPARIRFEYAVSSPDQPKPLNTGFTLHGFTGKDLRPFNMKKHHPEIFQMLMSGMESSIL